MKIEQYKLTDRITKERLEIILKLQNAKGLTADSLLEEAKKKQSPLHELFEWDDNVASNLYRLQQARVIINDVKVIIEGNLYPAIENVRVSIEGIDGQKIQERIYIARDEIMAHEDLREQIIKRALNNIRYWREQYKNYSEFSLIIKAIDKTSVNLDKTWQKKKKK